MRLSHPNGDLKVDEFCLSDKIKELLKPKDVLDNLIVWTVTDINDKLFNNNHKSEIREILKDLEEKGIMENTNKISPKWRLAGEGLANG